MLCQNGNVGIRWFESGVNNVKSLVFPISFLWKELRLDAATTMRAIDLRLEQTWVLCLPV